MIPARGQVWRNKRTKREARVLSVRLKDAGYVSDTVDFKYRTSNPDSTASQMVATRRMTVPNAIDSFLDKFEFVREMTDEEKARSK